MTKYQPLGLRLFLSYLVIILIGAGIMIFTAEAALPQSFNRHMMEMMGTPVPDDTRGRGMGMGYGRPAEAGNNPLYDNFRAGFTEAMLIAVAAATFTALGVSFFFSRGITAPLRAMSAASQRIAAGRYDERVEISGADELAQLGQQFNAMAVQLQQVEAMRQQLLGDVSHELRTPLTAIKGYMEGLMDGVIPATAETYQQIHTEADRLARLVDDLQELSRVEAGAFRLEKSPQSLPALIATTARRLAPRFEAKNITVSQQFPEGLPPVLVDSDRVIQILTNLLGNALTYTPVGGQVTITARPEENAMLRVSLRDSGLGIPAESLPHLFDRFYRVDKSRSRQEGGGSGIGLTIAKALVEAHGGQIGASSPGPGLGSEFFFTLPTTSQLSAPSPTKN